MCHAVVTLSNSLTPRLYNQALPAARCCFQVLGITYDTARVADWLPIACHHSTETSQEKA
jgi:hypothetical protein